MATRGKLQEIVYHLEDGTEQVFPVGLLHHSGNYVNRSLIKLIASGFEKKVVQIDYKKGEGGTIVLKGNQLEQYFTGKCNKCGGQLPENSVIPVSQAEIEKAEKNFGEQKAHWMIHHGEL